MDEALFYLGNSDIMCFSETWLNPNVDDPLLVVDGYTYLRQDRTYGSQGGGPIIYIKETLAPYVATIQECSYIDKI